MTALAGIGGITLGDAGGSSYNCLVCVLVRNNGLLSAADADAVNILVQSLEHLKAVMSTGSRIPVMSVVYTPNISEGMLVRSFFLVAGLLLFLVVGNLFFIIFAIFNQAEIAENAVNSITGRKANRDHSTKKQK